MESDKIWNRIVKHYKDNFGSKEEVLQNDWTQIFSDLFNYSKFFGEIDSHRTMHIGSHERTIPDIIIRNDEEDLFDVELKQYSMPFSMEMERQLKSYLDLLHVCVGVIICKSLFVYVYDFSKSKSKKLEIQFIEDNPDGIKFVELFKKGSFSINKVEEFIDSKEAFSANVRAIKSDLNEKHLLQVIKDHYLKKYSCEEVEEAFKSVEISVDTLSYTVPSPRIAPIVHTIIRNTLAQYENQKKLIVVPNSPINYIQFKTNEMESILPDAAHKRGSWGTGSRYYFWLGERDGNKIKAIFELGGWDLDEKASETMRKIISLEKPNDRRAEFRYKRIHTEVYDLSAMENVEDVIKHAINSLLRWQEFLLKKMKL